MRQMHSSSLDSNSYLNSLNEAVELLVSDQLETLRFHSNQFREEVEFELK